ncbi:MAG: glycosyltransferase family 2 protein [Rhabdochlamydiaceae bacterium]|nr:glycosyltransferase family 2 protein [Rhabdochlamydiaceae bacterium]
MNFTFYLSRFFVCSCCVLFVSCSNFVCADSNVVNPEAVENSEIVEKPMVVIIPSYNNEEWVEKNLKSVLSQDYSNYRIIYVNDKSDDQTLNKIYQTLLEYQGPIDFRVISNTHRKGALANLYNAIQSCKDHEIVLTLDGDDWLANDQVLKKLNEVYSGTKPIWLTYGSFLYFPAGYVADLIAIPEEVIKNNAFRRFRHVQSHLRTFYAGLFKKIKIEDLMYNGEFFMMTWDWAMMFPMIEMAGERHSFITDVLYVYNRLNPINDDKVNQRLQDDLASYIREMSPYQRLPDEDLKIGN